MINIFTHPLKSRLFFKQYHFRQVNTGLKSTCFNGIAAPWTWMEEWSPPNASIHEPSYLWWLTLINDPLESFQLHFCAGFGVVDLAHVKHITNLKIYIQRLFNPNIIVLCLDWIIPFQYFFQKIFFPTLIYDIWKTVILLLELNSALVKIYKKQN